MTAEAPSTASRLAHWATALAPRSEDIDLARRSLVDTVAVALAARSSDIGPLVRQLPAAGRWAGFAHALDFDDLHVESTSHVSAVCVPAVLADGGDARAYLAAAGVMVRIGAALGWQHYARGWHATCTAGAPAAAVAAAVSRGMGADEVMHAMCLAVPAAGGNQGAFGTWGKSLQVAFAVDAGVRAASLASAGARTDPATFDRWLRLLGGSAEPADLDLDGPAVPGGLAVKLVPCCYALQRPIEAARQLVSSGLVVDEIASLRVETPASTLQPLAHRRPETGQEGQFSLEYGVAAALVDRDLGFAAFTDDAVRRPDVRRLIELIDVRTSSDGEGLLAGTFRLVAVTTSGALHDVVVDLPPGAPGLPADAGVLDAKVSACAPDMTVEMSALTWDSAARLMSEELGIAMPVR